MPKLVPMERNLEELPTSLLTKRTSTKPAVLQFKRSYSDSEGEVEVDQRWISHPSGAIGLWGPVDADTYVATNTLLSRAGGMPSSMELDLSLYELRALLGWTGGKENYRVLRDSVKRIGRTAFESLRAFYSKRSQAFLEDTIHIWTSHFKDFREIRGRRSIERHSLSFSKHFARSHLDGYVVYLDVDFYFSLTLASSKRLQRMLNASATGNLLEVALPDLRGQVPLSSRYRYPAELERKLEPAHEELRAGGYLTDFSWDRRETGLIAVYELNPRFVRLREDLALEANLANRPALEMMAAAGIPRQTRLRELKEHGASRCYEVAELLPYQRNVRDPIKLFVSTCEHGVPDWWRKVARERIEVPSGRFRSGLPESQDPVEPPVKVPEAEAPEESSDAVSDPSGADRGDMRSKEPFVPDPEALPIWEAALESIAEEINTPSFMVWFEGTVPVGVDRETLTIVAPNTFAQDYISDRFKDQLEAALTTGLGEGATLRILVNGQRAETNTGTTPIPEPTSTPQKEGG